MSTNPDAIPSHAAADPVPNATVVADRDITLTVDDHRQVDVFAGTAIPPALVDAYRKATAGDAPDAPDAPGRARGRSATPKD